MADFDSEFCNLNTLRQKNYYNKIPKILEFGTYKEKRYLVISKINGLRLSEVLPKQPKKEKLSYKLWNVPRNYSQYSK